MVNRLISKHLPEQSFYKDALFGKFADAIEQDASVEIVALDAEKIPVFGGIQPIYAHVRPRVVGTASSHGGIPPYGKAGQCRSNRSGIHAAIHEFLNPIGTPVIILTSRANGHWRSFENFLVCVQHGGHGIRSRHFDIRRRGRSGSGAPAALPRPREPGPGVRPVGSGRVLCRAGHSERERARGKSSVVDLAFPVRQARGFRIPEEDFPVGGVHGGFGSRERDGPAGSRRSGGPAGSRQPRELGDQVVRGSGAGPPELPNPRVEVLEDERVVRPELRPRGVVELVHLREVVVEVGRGKRGVRRIARLGDGVGLHFGDEAVEDGGSLALGEARQEGVGRRVPVGVRHGPERSAVAGRSSERKECRGGENGGSDQGLPERHGYRFHKRGNEGNRFRGTV